MPGKNQVMTQDKQELTASQKFMEYAIKEFTSSVGDTQVTPYQRDIMQGYFIAIDKALKLAEDGRLRKNKNNKNHNYDNNLPIIWANVNLEQLAVDVKHYSKMQLDMLQPNHLSAIPFKDKKSNKYIVTFIEGYVGLQYIAEKYALDKPKNVVTELVYKNDMFKAIKKSVNSNIENYQFEIENAFDRGEIVGGFGYIEYEDSTKNKLVIMTLKDILKRKPKYAAAEFWGGKTTGWENGKKVEVETDGWYEEMCLKTLKRFVYNSIKLDPEKIDENYRCLQESKVRYAEMESVQQIEENANTEEFVIPEEDIKEEDIKETVVEVVDADEDWQKED